MNRGAANRVARANIGRSFGRNSAWANRATLNNGRSLSRSMARSQVGAIGNSVNGNLSLNGGTSRFGGSGIRTHGSNFFGSNYANSRYGNGGYGYGNGGYGYGNGGYGYGGYGYANGYRNSNLVRVYLPGFGWVLVPRRAIIY